MDVFVRILRDRLKFGFICGFLLIFYKQMSGYFV